MQGLLEHVPSVPQQSRHHPVGQTPLAAYPASSSSSSSLYQRPEEDFALSFLSGTR